MRVSTELDHVLVSVKNGMISTTVISVALIEVWNVSENDGTASNLLKSVQLIRKPMKHVAWILEGGNRGPVELIANVIVE